MKKIDVGFDKIDLIGQISDIHIRNFRRHHEYRAVFKTLYSDLKEQFRGNNSLICLTGDIAHAKLDISPELISMITEFFTALAKQAHLIVIPGNHDALITNPNRLDVLTPIVNALNNPRIHYFKKSGAYKIADATFVVMSIFDEPSKYLKASEVEGDTKIALYHGIVNKSKTDLGFELHSDMNADMFSGYSISLLGDIHKHQFLNKEKTIGIVGGVGPYAGIDLAGKIFDQTIAKSDQEHLSVILLSFPKDIEERTLFLLGKITVNPAHAIFKIIRRLEETGAFVVGIPCNTVHSPQIFDVIIEKLTKVNSKIKIVNMIDEVAIFIRENYPQIRKVGLLSTTGTYKTKIYNNILEPKGINLILPDEVLQNSINMAIYDPVYGIKAQSSPVTEAAKSKLTEAIKYLQNKGTEAIILGCSEIPLAITDNKIGETLMIDPTLILARALIRSVNPDKLKPYSIKK